MKQPKIVTSNTTNRREFLRRSVGVTAALSLAADKSRLLAAEAAPELVASIERVVLRSSRGGHGPTWFHPRACMVPGPSGMMALMTLQPIAGSDYFGPVH